jgi:hypothetical protein
MFNAFLFSFLNVRVTRSNLTSRNVGLYEAFGFMA